LKIDRHNKRIRSEKKKSELRSKDISSVTDYHTDPEYKKITKELGEALEIDSMKELIKDTLVLLGRSSKISKFIPEVLSSELDFDTLLVKRQPTEVEDSLSEREHMIINEYNLINEFLKSKLSIRRYCLKHRVPEYRLSFMVNYFREHGKVSSLDLYPRRQVELPSSEELLSMIEMLYAQRGYIASTWSEFVRLFKVQFPQFSCYSYSYLQRRLKKAVKVHPVKIREASKKRSLAGSLKIRLEIIMRLCVLYQRDYNIVYIDESSVQDANYMQTALGSSEYPPLIKVPASTYCVNVLAAFSARGVEAIQFSTMGFISETFFYWFKSVHKKLKRESNKKRPKICFFMDNCSIHRSQSLLHYIQKHRVEVIFNVSRTPELNPIEMMFSHIKADLRQTVFFDNWKIIELYCINIRKLTAEMSEGIIRQVFKHGEWVIRRLEAAEDAGKQKWIDNIKLNKLFYNR